MTPRDLRHIQTTRNRCRDAFPCANMALKLPQYFYLLMEKPLGRYFQVRSPYYQATQYNQKTPIPISSRWQVRSEKAKKAKHQQKSQLPPGFISPSLNWSNNKARLSFNQPNRKRWGAKLVDIKHLPHKAFLLWHLH